MARLGPVRAEYLVTTGRRRDPRIDDAWVAHARTAVRGHGGPRSRAAVIRAAEAVWAGPPTPRAELEARLLTTDPVPTVAARCGLPVAVVDAYAAVFFAVRPMRAATDWILARAIGYGPAGFTSPQPGGVWKYAGYFGGSLVLDAVMAATTDRPFPDDLARAPGPRQSFPEARLRLTRVWVELLTATTDREVARAVAARQQLRAEDARRTGHAEPVDATLRALEAFPKGLPAMTRRGQTRRADLIPARPAVNDPDRGSFDESRKTGRRAEPHPLRVAG